MLRVGINGYGTIGKRVADAVRAQPDMTVCGVAKVRPDYVAVGAAEAGYPLYVVDEGLAREFREIDVDVDGTVEDLVEESDVMIDATPSGVGAENRPLYERYETPALFQGGEEATVAEVSFNARANFAEAAEADYVRVVSCNTTGLARLVAPLHETYGVETVRATLVRRGGDPSQTGRGPINDVVLDPATIPSHHGPDVQTLFPELAIDTIGLTVPTTMMHVHSVAITLETAPDDETELRNLLATEDRIVLVPAYAGIDGAGKLKDLAHDAGRPRGDVWENVVWEESLTVRGRECYCVQAIHQESDVVPENVDAIRALTGGYTARESTALTDRTLGIGFDRLRERAGATVDRGVAD